VIIFRNASRIENSEVLRSRSPSSCKRVRSCGLLRDENKDFSYAEAQRDFGFSPLAFEEGIGLESESV
jgi:hypothetical protein